MSYQPYGYPQQSQPPPQQTQPNPNLQFYSAGPSANFYQGGYDSSNLGGSISTNPQAAGGTGYDGSSGGGAGVGGSIVVTGPWWMAFGPGGVEGEPPLLEELGVNFSHILQKSLTVLNPLRPVSSQIMDDADMAGPIVFFMAFAVFLLLSGKPQFSTLYGVSLIGSASLYFLLNAMSDHPIDAYRVVSILGYCLLPMVGLGAVGGVVALDGLLGALLTFLTIVWCTYSASGIFVAVLNMSRQRLLVAYPVLLLYGCFALLSVFDGRSMTR